MKKHLNTLFVTKQGAYLSKEKLSIPEVSLRLIELLISVSWLKSTIFCVPVMDSYIVNLSLSYARTAFSNTARYVAANGIGPCHQPASASTITPGMAS